MWACASSKRELLEHILKKKKKEEPAGAHSFAFR